VHVRAWSAACVPAWLPAALLWATLLCWLPLGDGGANRANIHTLRRRLEHAPCGAGESSRWVTLRALAG
jgi:hypothetical protein